MQKLLCVIVTIIAVTQQILLIHSLTVTNTYKNTNEYNHGNSGSDSNSNSASIDKELNQILQNGIVNRVYPGVVAIAGDKYNNYFYANSFGTYKYLANHTYSNSYGVGNSAFDSAGNSYSNGVGNSTGNSYSKSVAYSAGDSYDVKNNFVKIDSMFDMASVSKVLATTTAIALLVQNNYIQLDNRVDLLINEPLYNTNNKSNITVLNCLLHNAGYAPDPSPTYFDKNFNCANNNDYHPMEDFSCADNVYNSLLEEELINNIGEVYLYSDLSFITLQMVIGAVASNNSRADRTRKSIGNNNLVNQNELRSDCMDSLKNGNHQTNGLLYMCYFEAFVRKYVFQSNGFTSPSKSYKDKGLLINGHLRSTSSKVSSTANNEFMPRTGYLPPVEMKDQCLPTLNDTLYTHKRIQGQVSDGDCYAMGGLCGHAGVFSNAMDIGRLLTRLLSIRIDNVDPYQSVNTAQNTIDGGKLWLNSITIQLFTTEYNHTQSSRALGWTTNDPYVNDYGFDQSCGNFSSATFMHIGYTGTCICVDPVNQLWSVILTNRVYNCNGQTCPPDLADKVKSVYRNFHSTLINKVQSITKR